MLCVYGVFKFGLKLARKMDGGFRFLFWAWFEICYKYTITLWNWFRIMTNTPSTASGLHCLYMKIEKIDVRNTRQKQFNSIIHTARLISPTQIQSDLSSLTPHFEWSSVVGKKILSLNFTFDTFHTLKLKNRK